MLPLRLATADSGLVLASRIKSSRGWYVSMQFSLCIMHERAGMKRVCSSKGSSCRPRYAQCPTATSVKPRLMFPTAAFLAHLVIQYSDMSSP